MISNSLIEKAKSRGACPDDIKWLEESPRSFEGLVSRNINWAEWAVRNLCSMPALKTYDDTIASALKAYCEAIAPAWKVYVEAVAPALKAYNEAMASALLTALKILEVKRRGK